MAEKKALAPETQVQLNVLVPKSVKRAAKIKAAKSDTSIATIVTEALRKFAESELEARGAGE